MTSTASRADVVGVVVDTSAIMAILLNEPDSDRFLHHLHAANPRLMSAATRVELGMVAEARLGSGAADVVHRLLRDMGIELVPVDADAADRAMSAWRRFGKGRHPAALNLGDCFTYATAERSGFPIMCTGADFAATDLAVVR